MSNVETELERIENQIARVKEQQLISYLREEDGLFVYLCGIRQTLKKGAFDELVLNSYGESCEVPSEIVQLLKGYYDKIDQICRNMQEENGVDPDINVFLNDENT